MSKIGEVQKIPLLDLAPEIESLWDDLNQAIAEVLRSGRFILGPVVRQFESEVADYLGVPQAVGLSSGTDALVIGLRALGIGRGDEVITTPFTFFATPESIAIVGATPVFVDIDPLTFNLDPGAVEAAVTPRTKAIMPVHLYGRPAEVQAIVEIAGRHELRVIEDCAQSFGARCGGRQTGTLGDVGAYSFFPSKNLGAFGDAGLLVTHDDGLAEAARMLRVHGAKKKYDNEMVDYNGRLDALQAAILCVKLPLIDRNNSARRSVAERYNALLTDVDGVVTPELVDGHVFHQYTIRVPDGRRDAVKDELDAAGIGSMVYYPVPCHRLALFRDGSPSLPAAEQAAREVLSLPLWPQMSEDIQERVVEVITRALVRS